MREEFMEILPMANDIWEANNHTKRRYFIKLSIYVIAILHQFLYEYEYDEYYVQVFPGIFIQIFMFFL